MRVVIQRVLNASVDVDGNEYACIGEGLLVFIGIEDQDTEEDVSWLANKITSLRIFSDKFGMMNYSILDLKKDILLISQFTLHAKTKKGNRPSYIKSANREYAIPLYNSFVKKTSAIIGKKVSSGVFGSNMQVQLVNDGPVTIIIDSKNRE
jgi:D-tyrosyl-tRNA(Tyr) deacylase